MPRFGLPPFANALPQTLGASAEVVLPDATRIALSQVTAVLPRVTQESDFHCVTGWSCTRLGWSGWRFSDVWAALGVDTAQIELSVIAKGADGYRSTLPLEDAMGRDVMIADTMNGHPLGRENGAPLRLIAPAHYGLKSVKHLTGLRILPTAELSHPLRSRLFSHPRARVAYEERSATFPRCIVRHAYRPLITANIRRFAEPMRTTTK